MSDAEIQVRVRNGDRRPYHVRLESGVEIAVTKSEILELALDLLEHDRSPMRRCLVAICDRWEAGDSVEALRRDYLSSRVEPQRGGEGDG